MNMFQKRDHPLYAYIKTYSYIDICICSCLFFLAWDEALGCSEQNVFFN